MLISSFFLLALSCDDSPPESWKELSASERCGKDIQCRAEECKTFHSSPRKTPENAEGVAKLCDELQMEMNIATQSCGIPACLILPRLNFTEALKRLKAKRARTAGEKGMKKAIVRGLMTEGLLDQALRDETKKESRWWGTAMAEADCGTFSIAGQFGMPCGGPFTSAAITALRRAQQEETAEELSRTAYNLALALAPEQTGKLILEDAMDKNLRSDRKKMALQSLLIEKKRSGKLPTSIDEIVKTECEKANTDIQSLCH